VVATIVNADACLRFERTPPELPLTSATRGIVLTGGAARLLKKPNWTKRIRE